MSGKLLELEKRALGPGPESDGEQRPQESPSEAAWLVFCLHSIKGMCQEIRRRRFESINHIVQFKADNSPVSDLEIAVEESLRDRLKRNNPEDFGKYSL